MVNGETKSDTHRINILNFWILLSKFVHRFFYSILFLSNLLYSHLILSHLLYSISSTLVSSSLISSPLLSSHLLYSHLILTSSYDWIFANMIILLDFLCSRFTHFSSFLNRHLLVYDPVVRLSATDALKHPYVCTNTAAENSSGRYTHTVKLSHTHTHTHMHIHTHTYTHTHTHSHTCTDTKITHTHTFTLSLTYCCVIP